MKMFSNGVFRVRPPKGVDTTNIKPASAPPSNSNAGTLAITADINKSASYEARDWAAPAGYISDIRDEQIELAESEVDEAKTLVRAYSEYVTKWEKLLALRRDNLERIKKS